MAGNIDDPLFGDEPARIHLDNAPLVRVLAQVRFPQIIKINDESYIGDFQEDLRHLYPFFARDEGQSVELGVVGTGMQVKPRFEVTWRFFDKSKQWRVSLANDFVTLETMKYTDRDDFMGRLQVILEALEKTIEPAVATRVGYRYVNRIMEEENLGRLVDLIEDRLVGVADPTLRDRVEQSLSDARCRTKEGGIVARWGLIPQGGTHDPGAMPPANSVCWMLDIDSYKEDLNDLDSFEPNGLRSITEQLASRAYTFFRWSVKEEFLKAYGGEQ